MAYFRPLFIGVDQLLNAIAGGNPDNTISSRIGYYARHAEGNQQKLWKVLEWITDKTFWPLEGPGHSYLAFRADAGEDFDADKSGVGVFMTFLLSLPFLILIAVVLWGGWLLGVVKQIEINRVEAIRGRLRRTEKMLISITEELEEECESHPSLTSGLDNIEKAFQQAQEQLESCIQEEGAN